ncbi:MAG: sulfatase-like hydrolase/transferase [Planctomycetota bacterium]|nr:sulfatase-like hydrolase/transferase [Planctomycetota bacterium]
MDGLGSKLRELVSQSVAWYYVALAWFGFVCFYALLFAFGCVKTSAAATNLIHIENFALLDAVDQNYGRLYLAMGLCGGAALLFVLLLWDEISATRRGNVLLALVSASVSLGLYTLRYTIPEGAARPDLHPPAKLAWVAISCTLLASVFFVLSLEGLARGLRLNEDPPESRDRIHFRVAWVYLVSTATVFLYAFLEHLKFWNSKANGGYNYAPFFQPGEHVQADLVLYSTSVLFASIVSLCCCLLYAIFRVLARQGPRYGLGLASADCRWHALAGAAAWSLVLMAPWQVKLYPEISEEGAWIMPAGLLLLTASALMPLIFVSLTLMKMDFDQQRANYPGEGFLFGDLRVRRSEYAFLAFFLCPVYPLLRALRPRFARLHYLGLMLCAGALLALLFNRLVYFEKHYTFDDWRDMVKAGIFPCLRVVLSLSVACLGYLCVQRIFLGWNFERGASWAYRWGGRLGLGAALAVLLLALWPLWGYTGVNRNVLARTYEYSSRHKFEIGFLHWMLDFDRDGYANLLVDRRVAPYLAKPGDAVAVKGGQGEKPAEKGPDQPVDEYAVKDEARALAFPNVVVLWLEGVTPRSISAYGQRKLDRPATPHLDALAADGTIFTRARCCYPSTWDGWFATISGRFLRVQEMKESSLSLKDRYSRHNGLHKVLALAGIERWCYPSVRPFTRLFCPEDDRPKDWEPNFDSIPSKDEEKAEVMRGDKCNERLLRFIDSLKPGDRFFMAEHMTDTHFPWKRSSLKRLKELGFEDDLAWCEKDAKLENTSSDIRARYYHTVTRMDGQIGALVERLKAKGLYDDTIFVIIGDHGCQWYEHEHLYYVSHLYEQSLHIPLIIKAPGFPKGLRSDLETLQFDVLPTLVELAGCERVAPVEKDRAPIGLSLAPALRGEKGAALAEQFRNRDVVMTTHFNMMGILERFRYKLTVDRLSGTYMLFDLEQDPMEMKNLADEQPERVQALLEKLRAEALRNKAYFNGFETAR